VKFPPGPLERVLACSDVTTISISLSRVYKRACTNAIYYLTENPLSSQTALISRSTATWSAIRRHVRFRRAGPHERTKNRKPSRRRARARAAVQVLARTYDRTYVRVRSSERRGKARGASHTLLRFRGRIRRASVPREPSRVPLVPATPARASGYRNSQSVLPVR